MQTDDGTVYLIQGHEDDEWLSPKPAKAVITDALFETTGLSSDDIDHIDAYVDPETLRAVVGEGDRETITFDIEGHEVTVTDDGDVTVA